MATDDLDPFVNPDLLEVTFNDLVQRLPKIPLDNRRSTETLYDIVKTSPTSTIFTKLIEQQPQLLSLFEDHSSGEHTIFLPVDSAWKTSLQDIDEDVLAAHISPHYVTTEGLLHMPNVPTILTPALSNGPQIIRTRFNSDGWQLNQTTRITKGNIIAKNGVIHQIDHVFLPPPDIVNVLELHDNLTFVRRAIELSGMLSKLTSADIKGRTLFAPTNTAFQDLGGPILSFLFDTAAGRPYLKVLLNLHFCPNITFFSNFIWPKNVTGARQTSADTPRRIKGKQTQTIRIVPTCEGVASTSITLARFNGLISMLVNDSAKVVLQDIATSDGVVQVIDRVLLPSSITDGTVRGQQPSLERLKQILDDYTFPDDLAGA